MRGRWIRDHLRLEKTLEPARELSPHQPTSVSGPRPGPPGLCRIRPQSVSAHRGRPVPFCSAKQREAREAFLGRDLPRDPAPAARRCRAAPATASLGKEQPRAVTSDSSSCSSSALFSEIPSHPLPVSSDVSPATSQSKTRLPAWGVGPTPWLPTDAACVPRPPPLVARGASPRSAPHGPPPVSGVPCSLPVPTSVDEPALPR